MKLSKHILAGFLLLLLAVPIISLQYLEGQKFFRQLYMREALEKQELSTIIVEKLHWVKKDKEILVAGRMFDVKSIKLAEGKYAVTGLYDDQEKSIRQIISLIEKKERDTAQKIGLLKGFAIYDITLINYSLTPPIYQKPTVSPFLLSKYKSTSVEILLQPPRSWFYIS